MNAEQIRAYARERLKKMEGENLKQYNSIMDQIKNTLDLDPTSTEIVIFGALHPAIKHRLREDDQLTVTTRPGGNNETDTIISWAAPEGNYWENR